MGLVAAKQDVREQELEWGPNSLHRRLQNFYQNRLPSEHFDNSVAPTNSSVVLCTNDYLSLAKHPKIINTHVNSLLRTGNGLLMSPVFLTDDSPQRKFEKRIAEFVYSEDALLVQSGWSANVGLLQAIADPETPVYIDMKAHMSLWEGVNTACAIARPFRHNDPGHLEKQMKKYGPGIVVVDSVYSTHGDVAPLEAIAELAEQHACLFVVDESHSLATHGPQGRGMVVGLGLQNKVHFRTSSLAKAFAGRGGIIFCSERHRNYFLYEAKPVTFSSAMLPHEADAFSATLDVIASEEWRREKLHANAKYLRDSLVGLGYNLLGSDSQIIALEAGPMEESIKLRNFLEKHDIFGALFWPPATPKNRTLIRLTVTAAMPKYQLEHVVEVCERIREEVGMNEWASTRRLERVK